MPPSSVGEPSATPIERLLSGDANPVYVAFHQPRFDFLVDVTRPHTSRPRCRVLDVGTSQLTSLLSKNLQVRVDSLGLMEDDREVGGAWHYRFDLNDAQERDRWRTDIGPYDLVVFAEVIEHLYTAPELVLAYLKELLVPRGVLIVQTPNAVALRKRMKMLLGRNPFERIRVDRRNPGHFREYTVSELRGLLAGAGFSIDSVWMKYYFDARFARHERGDEAPSRFKGHLKNTIYRLQPAALQEGITIVARKAAS